MLGRKRGWILFLNRVEKFWVTFCSFCQEVAIYFQISVPPSVRHWKEVIIDFHNEGTKRWSCGKCFAQLDRMGLYRQKSTGRSSKQTYHQLPPDCMRYLTDTCTFTILCIDTKRCYLQSDPTRYRSLWWHLQRAGLHNFETTQILLRLARGTVLQGEQFLIEWILSLAQ